MNEETGAGVFRSGHVGLNVSDIGRSEEFYRDVFGLRVVGGSEEAGRRYVFLGDGERIVLTLWQQGVGCFDKGSPGLHHLSFEVNSIEEVREAEARLREIGVPLIYGGGRAARRRDAVGGHLLRRPGRHPPRNLQPDRGRRAQRPDAGRAVLRVLLGGGRQGGLSRAHFIS